MKRSVRLALVAVFLASARSHAQQVKVAAGKAWGAPIAAAFMAYGTDRIGPDSPPALQRLANLGLGLQEAANNPALLKRLAEALAVQGLSPDSFAAKPVPARIAALTEAARLAEVQANVRSHHLVSLGLNADDEMLALDLATIVKSAAAEDMLYVSPALRTAYSALVFRVVAVEKARAEAVETFTHDLAGKIVAGAFTAENAFVKPGRYWHVADEGPLQRYDTLAQAYAARLREVRAMPPGPWQEDMLDVMADALNQNHVRQAALKEFGTRGLTGLAMKVQAARIESNRLRLYPSAARVKARREFMLQELDVRAGRAARVPSPQAVRTMYTERRAEAARPTSHRAAKYRILAHIDKGDIQIGDPSYKTLDAALTESIAQMGRRGKYVAGALLASIASLAAVCLSRPGLAVPGAVLLVGLAALLLRYAWRRHQLEEIRSWSVLPLKIRKLQEHINGFIDPQIPL
ncbi:MAG: hypothetical protein HYZ74_04790 [Elusimicrobia bacterium]|nr:hypothetical protein [Elusimicrobiota bacterium]